VPEHNETNIPLRWLTETLAGMRTQTPLQSQPWHMSEQTVGPDPALSGTLSRRVLGFCATLERTELEMLSRRMVQRR